MIEIFENQAKEIEYYSKKAHTVFERVDRNGTYIFHDCTCDRCGGKGIIPYYGHIDGGVCFECSGSGKGRSTEIKIYTDEYGAKLNAKRQAKAEEQSRKAAEERQKLIAQSEGRRKAWMEKEGFNEDGKTWMFLGNTYAIKEELKALGARYNGVLGWHINHDVEGYDTLVADVNDVTGIDYKGDFYYLRGYVPEGDDPEIGGYSMEEHMKEVREESYANLHKTDEENVSEYVGTVKERRDFVCKLVGHFCYESNFGGYGYWTDNTMHIYKFKDEDGNVIVWNTSNFLDDSLPEYKFKATIKEHSEYKGEKQTVITRPKFSTEC